MTNISRRSITKAGLWATPAVLVVGSAPAYATSENPRKDPGINGWVQVSYGTNLRFDATFDSDPEGVDPSTPDGALFGLYVYDTQPGDLISGASITLWFRGVVSSWVYGTRTTSVNGGGHGRDWSAPISVGTETKPDGLTYHGYRFDYTGPTVLVGGLVWLQDIEVTARRVNSSDATFWVERRIAVNGQMQAFQRRNGERGPLGQGFPVGRMSASAQSVVAGGQGLV